MTTLARPPQGRLHERRTQRRACASCRASAALPLTPNQLTVGGFLLNVVAGVLIYEEHWVWATVVFVAGSVIDALDGAWHAPTAR